MNNPPFKLEKYRPQLLLAEAIALLHDLGKLHTGHLFKYTQEHTPQGPIRHELREFGHHQILSKIEAMGTSLSLWSQEMRIPLHKTARGSGLSLEKAIEKHHKPTNDASRLLRTTDTLDSSADRSAVFNAGQQSLCATCIATALGRGICCYALTENDAKAKLVCAERGPATELHIREKYASVCDQSADGLEEALYEVLDKTEPYLQGINNKETPLGHLWETRREFLKEIREQYSKTLGETRRAANDVTLWDHSYSVATLYKAALSGLLLDPPEEFATSQIRWRIFRVGFDGLGIIAKGHRIGDMLGYHKMLDDAKDEVKRLVEVEWALGNEVYHDENGIYFLVPALRVDSVREDLEQTLDGAARGAILKATKGEVVPVIGFGGDEDPKEKNGSRGLTRLGGEIAQTDVDVRIPIPDAAQPEWPTQWSEWKQLRTHLRDRHDPDDATRLTGQCEYCAYLKKCAVWDGEDRPQVDGCPVCNARPKCENQTVCPVCSARRERRVRVWYDEGRTTTVWIDEIADRNDRVAVLIGRFDLTHWLDGRLNNTYLNTFLIHSMKDWEQKAKLRDANRDTILDYLRPAAAWAASSFGGRLPKEDVGRLATFFEYFNWNRPDSELEMAYERAAEPVDRTPENLALLLFRKHPSPARLRRIWETAERFWEEVVVKVLPGATYDSFRDEKLSGFHTARFHRLALRVDRQRTDHLPTVAYQARIGTLRTALYWTGERFIVVDNLQRLLEQSGKESMQDLAASLPGQSISLELPLRGQERARRSEPSLWGDLTVAKAYDTNDDYRPFAHILTTPRLFIALVPGVDAADIAQAIHKKYESEFSKVKNRLPLHLGLVYFHRRTPLYAAMDTARRMLPEGCRPPETWNLIEKAGDGGEVKLRFDNGVEWTVDTTTGDPAVPDDYYPYFLIEAEDHPLSVLKVPDPTRDGESIPLVHVRDLSQNEDNKVRVDASLFDFEFLDTIGRRFEVSYADGMRRRREGLGGPRPYYLDRLKEFRRLWWLLSGHYAAEFEERQGLTPTQLSNLEMLIGAQALEWGKGDWGELKTDPTFGGYIWATLANVGGDWWKSLNEGEKTLIVQAACDGTLLDVIELYQKIMKVKPLGKEVG
jgi:hypothetical protein